MKRRSKFTPPGAPALFRPPLFRPPFAPLTALLVAAVTLVGCSTLAVMSAPKKQASTVRTPAAVEADALFWTTLHGGHYDRIQSVLDVLTAAYLKDPADAKTAAHVGWLHIWRLAERNRNAPVAATITDEITLARKYFGEAVALDPGEARYAGFLASTELAEGEIHHDEATTRRGYYRMLDAIDAWPEFNLFSGGYVTSGRPAQSERFRQALEWQWLNLDVCVGAKLDRTTADMAPYMALETREGKARACWNSWIAPHNFEGFFLNMGDMVVKSGDWALARKVYANARLSSTFAEWKFRDVLERRIRDAESNVERFRNPGPGSTDDSRIMFASGFACMACHQD